MTPHCRRLRSAPWRCTSPRGRDLTHEGGVRGGGGEKFKRTGGRRVPSLPPHRRLPSHRGHLPARKRSFLRHRPVKGDLLGRNPALEQRGPRSASSRCRERPQGEGRSPSSTLSTARAAGSPRVKFQEREDLAARDVQGEAPAGHGHPTRRAAIRRGHRDREVRALRQSEGEGENRPQDTERAATAPRLHGDHELLRRPKPRENGRNHATRTRSWAVVARGRARGRADRARWCARWRIWSDP